MNLKLHANATTTPRIRAYIRASTASNNALARELGIHSRTVARWKARDQLFDRSTRPHCRAVSCHIAAGEAAERVRHFGHASEAAHHLVEQLAQRHPRRFR